MSFTKCDLILLFRQVMAQYHMTERFVIEIIELVVLEKLDKVSPLSDNRIVLRITQKNVKIYLI